MSAMIYSFYLESEPGVPAPGMNPEINLVKILPDGTNFPEELLEGMNDSLRDLGDGVYTFDFDWDLWDTLTQLPGFTLVDTSFYGPEIKRSLFVKIKTGFETQDQAFISMRIERQDILPELVDRVQVSANSLAASSNALNTTAEKILAIEEGSWVVRENKLLIFNKTTAMDQMTDANAIYSFDLKDQNGHPTDENPFSRIVTGI